MRMMIVASALAFVAQAAPSAVAAGPPCTRVDRIDYARKSDLPPGALAALGFEMAEGGQPFQATDVVSDPPLPFRRFVSARQIGCTLQIEFERGGRGLSRQEVSLQSIDRGWASKPR